MFHATQRRVISSDSDLLALNASIPSARRVCSSSVPGGACVSVSGGACRGLHVLLVVVVHLLVSLEHCVGSVRRVHINLLLVLDTIRGNTVTKLLEEQRCRTSVRGPRTGFPS